MRRFTAWFRNSFRRPELDRDLEAELDAHIELLAGERIAQGMAPDDARRQARLEMQGVQQVKEKVVEVRTGLWLEQLWQDVRYGARMLRKSTGFTALAVITLALGIGANSAMFSVIDGVILQRPPFRDPSRVVCASQILPNGNSNIFSVPDYLEWKRQNTPLSGMAALMPQGHTLGTSGGVERIQGFAASHEAFSVFGVAPTIGRPFTAEEDIPNAAKVLVLSDALWKNRFAADPAILGQKVDLDGSPYTVIGVMPPGFKVFSDNEQFWTPLQMQTQDAATSSRTVHLLFALVRLPSGSSLKQAQAAIDTAAANLRRQNPQDDAGHGVRLQTFQDWNLEGIQAPLWLLMGAVGFVLLIACSNVANLLLARGTTRRLEMSIRSAVGAQRSRIMRQLLTESLLLSLLGSGLGLLIAFVSLKTILALHMAGVPSVESIRINVTVLNFNLAVGILVGVLFGVAPAWTGSRIDISNALLEGGRSGGSVGEKKKRALIIGETALASLLLVGAGLALKSFWKLNQVDPGFSPHGLLTFRIDAPAGSKDQPFIFYRDVIERVRALPGVTQAALVRNVPLSGIDPSIPVAVDGGAPPVTDGQVVTRFRLIGSDYFRTFQTPLLAGREFAEEDTGSSQPVVIISLSLKERYWPNQNPLGKMLKPNLPGAPWYTVVGVVADVHHSGLDADASPTAYYAYTQVPKSVLALAEKFMTIAVRSTNSAGLMDSVRQAVASVDPGSPVYSAQTMDELVSASQWLRRLDTGLIVGFAGLALLLAAVGIYGVMSYSVSQRTREIGIRLALGARRSDVLWMIVSQGLRIALAGIAIGLSGAAALARLMALLVYQTSTRDLATFLLVGLSALLFILMACYIPCLRSTQIDPNIALRHE